MTKKQIESEIAYHESVIKTLEAKKPDRLTVEEVYYKSLAKVMWWCPDHLPLMEDGMPVVRVPRPGEWAASDPGSGSNRPFHVNTSWDWDDHLILTRKPKPRRLVYRVIDSGRPPRVGEVFKTPQFPNCQYYSYDGPISALNHTETLILGIPGLEDGE